ncbi:MAG: PspC domain-containing protein [Aigarchaeota archaeon]|nr:PspC domain-containing protein [Aigarchaeota archaeon]
MNLSSKRLLRSEKDRVLAGVIGGLGEYLNVDSNLLRIVAVVLLIISPILMIILYLIGVFLIPRVGEEKPLATSFEIEKYLSLIVGVVLILIGAALLGSTAITPIFWFYPFYGFEIFTKVIGSIIAIVLIIVGAVIILPILRKL